MTKEEKQIIYDACELIECGVWRTSCYALSKAHSRAKDESLIFGINSDICRRYVEFFRKSLNDLWDFSDNNSPEGRMERIIALLLFAEAEGDL